MQNLKKIKGGIWYRYMEKVKKFVPPAHQFKGEKILRKMVQTGSLHPPANLRFALPTPANPKTANIVYREVLSQ